MNIATYPKARLAAIKKHGGIYIAEDILYLIKIETDAYEMSLNRARASAIYQVSIMTTRQLYVFLKNNGYTFDSKYAVWRFADKAVQP